MAAAKTRYLGSTTLAITLIACAPAAEPASSDSEPNNVAASPDGAIATSPDGGDGARADANMQGSLDAGSGTGSTQPDASVHADGASDAAATMSDAQSDAAGATPVCGSAAENGVVILSCPQGQIIDSVAFASYGSPSGACGSFAQGSCNAATSTSVVEQLCVGRASCTVPASNGSFGDPCNKLAKQLSIEARCATGTPSVAAKPFKGVANSPCAARQALQVSWYYNWEQSETEACKDGSGGAFVPMIWGHTGAEQDAASITSAVASFVAKGYKYVLGFNEPDNSTQSNIPVSKAIALWPAFDNPAIAVVSPGTQANANPGQAWFKDFMTQLQADASLRSDVIGIHWYGWNAGSCDANAAQLENYIKWAEGFAGGRPIWITEWGCLNQSAADDDTVLKFYQAALRVFAKHPRIERYAWYPWAAHCSLVNSDGSLTALGKAYAAAPATR